METTRVSTKGQVVLPKALRDALDWEPGTELVVSWNDDSAVLRKNTGIRPSTVEEVAGMLKYEGPPVSLDDMQRGIDEALKERWLRKSR